MRGQHSYKLVKETKADGAADEAAVCYVVGPMKLQNELMAAHLKHQTGNDCLVVEDLHQIRGDERKGKSRQELLFLDCQGKSLKVLMAELRPFIGNNLYESRIVLFNVPTDVKFQKEYILKGIHGFFYERDPLDNFTKGVQAVLDGQLWFSREMMTSCIFEGTGKRTSSKNTSEVLTERQIEILAMIAVGATNDEISDKLCISPHTVKTHLYRIFKKINVPNRVQAALWAVKNL